jgi:hypothetical protein
MTGSLPRAGLGMREAWQIPGRRVGSTETVFGVPRRKRSRE